MKEEDIKIGNWYRVPAQTYEGYVLAKVIGVRKRGIGEKFYSVEAINEVWYEATHGGYAPTKYRRFYAEGFSEINTKEQDFIRKVTGENVNENKEGKFKITRAKGFHITFQNGYTVSVQFGFGNYCKNQCNLTLDGTELKRPNEMTIESPDAEVAVWRTGVNGLAVDGEFIDLPQFGIDQVGGWKSPEEVLEILNWAKEQK